MSVDGRVLFEGQAMPHFNEVDECAGLDALITNRVWNRLGYDPETTLHDLRYGEPYTVRGKEEFVWVFEISGSVPPNHLISGYAGTVSERQPPMYFPLGGGTIKGISKPGEVVWSRIFVEDNRLKADVGTGRGRRVAARRDRETLEDHHAPVADHARRHEGRQPRQDDGQAQVESHPSGLRSGPVGGTLGAKRQDCCVPQPRHRSFRLRHRPRACVN